MTVLTITIASLLFTLSASLYALGITFPWIMSRLIDDRALETLWAILWPFALFALYIGASVPLLWGLSILH